MKVPFFRSKASSNTNTTKHGGSSIKGRFTLRSQKNSQSMSKLEGIVSDTELSTYSMVVTPPLSSEAASNPSHIAAAAASALSPASSSSGPMAHSTVHAIAGQLKELESFLTKIDGFQNEARRLFPENMALDQILNDLRDECRRRADYMAKVSTPTWLAGQQKQNNSHQRQSSSSSATATNVGGGGYFQPSSHTTAGRKTPMAKAQQRRKTGSFAQYLPELDISPISTVSGASNGSTDSSRSTGHRSIHDMARKNNSSQQSAAPAAAAGKRNGRAAEHRRKTAPQSMFIAGSPRENSSTSRTMQGPGINGTKNRSSTLVTASNSRQPRSSMLMAPGLDAPRLAKPRTSSVDNLQRPISMVNLAASSSATQLNNMKGTATPMLGGGGGTNTALRASRQQHMPNTHHSGKTSNDYLVNISLYGRKIEAAVSPSLQTSLISLQMAKMMGMPVIPIHTNTRVWSTAGKSWQVIGEVSGLPFVCGKMTFTNGFKVAQGSAGSNDMTRDIMLGNDFCVGNKGKVKDNVLHLEQLCMPITVPVRPVKIL